jgi:uncharacterized repeat protein (TIGR01451 family)
MAVASVAFAGPNPGNNVTICHGTNSDKNPYVQESPNADADAGGHAGHTGPVWNSTLKASHTAWGDIIPPFDYNTKSGVQHFPGLNWNAAGQAIWNNGCNLPGAAFTIAKSQTSPVGNAAPGGAVTYSVTITNNGGPTTGTTTVTDTLPANVFNDATMVKASGAGSWTCANSTAGTASQSPSCDTTDSLGSGDSTTFTVSTSVKSTTGAGTYTNSATVASDDGSHSDTADTTVAVGAGPSNVTLAGACTAGVAGNVTWTVTNPAGNGQLTLLVISSSPPGVAVTGPVSTTIASGGTTTFTTAAPLAAGTTMSAAGKVGGQSVGSNTPDFTGSCPTGVAENAAKVVFAPDCTGILATFTSADQHTTTFTVSPPLGGATDTVIGSGSKHYAADVGNAHISVVFDASNASSDWSDPGGCNNAVGQADPNVAEANHCKSGMNLTLSNMNGTADETFTVVDPSGTVHQVVVRAGQLKKVVFSVKEDSTGTVSVTGKGLAKQSFAYHKNCATVLGVKHTRKPPHKPVVKGEHAQLPFTGFNLRRALLDGSVVFFVGAVLCILGARRREEEPLYY